MALQIDHIKYAGNSKIISALCTKINAVIDAAGTGGGSKHIIQNESGTSMTDRTSLQFTGATVSDDSTNDRTVVAIPTYTDATQSASGLMSATDKTKLDGIDMDNVAIQKNASTGTVSTSLDKSANGMTFANNSVVFGSTVKMTNLYDNDYTSSNTTEFDVIESEIEHNGNIDVWVFSLKNAFGDKVVNQMYSSSTGRKTTKFGSPSVNPNDETQLIGNNLKVLIGNYTIVFPQASGTLALTNDNLSQFTNDIPSQARFALSPEVYFNSAGANPSTSRALIWHQTDTQLIISSQWTPENQKYSVRLGVTDNARSFTPHTSGVLNLGSASYKWNNVYATNGTIQTSDKNKKKDIVPLDEETRYMELFDKLQPVTYKMKDGTSGRTHVGLIAQDVEDAMFECGMSDLDFAGLCKDKRTEFEEIKDEDGNTIDTEEKIVTDADGNPIYDYSLRYDEFVALNTMAIQNLQRRIEVLERRVEDGQSQE